MWKIRPQVFLLEGRLGCANFTGGEHLHKHLAASISIKYNASISAEMQDSANNIERQTKVSNESPIATVLSTGPDRHDQRDRANERPQWAQYCPRQREAHPGIFGRRPGGGSATLMV